ncbi:DNA-directed RNA polymerase subunit RPC12/RpoP [Paraburkholderia sp. MM5496-R1]
MTRSRYNGPICPKCGRTATFEPLSKDPRTQQAVYRCGQCNRTVTEKDFNEFRARTD